MIQLIIYLLGIIPAYLSLKCGFLKAGEEWTCGQRRFTMALSIMSWASAIYGTLLLLSSINATDDDKPVKW